MIDGVKLSDKHPIVSQFFLYLLGFLRVAVITPMVTILFAQILMLVAMFFDSSETSKLFFEILLLPLTIRGYQTQHITQDNIMDIYFSWLLPISLIALFVKKVLKIKIPWTLKEKIFLSVGWAFLGWILIFITAFFVEFKNKGSLSEFAQWDLLFCGLGLLYTLGACFFGLFFSSLINTIEDRLF